MASGGNTQGNAASHWSISEILRRVMKVKYMIAIIIINTKGKRRSLRIIIILIIIIFD